MRIASFSAALFLLSSSVAFAQRLPTNVTPVHYDITVTPRLADATFGGHITIRVRLASPSSTIVLNAAEIKFGAASINAGGRRQQAEVAVDPPREQATFKFPAPVPAGDADLDIAYEGILNDDLRGLYLSKANNRRYAVTQLEATDARRMFPSFDEPAFKATFALTAIIDEKDHAIRTAPSSRIGLAPSRQAHGRPRRPVMSTPSRWRSATSSATPAAPTGSGAHLLDA